MKLLLYTWYDFERDFRKIRREIKLQDWKVDGIFGVPKGGLPLAVKLANHLELPLYTTLEHIHNKENILIIDDISDSGKTLLDIPNIDKYKVITLFFKTNSNFKPSYYANECYDEWIVFPWEPTNKETKRDGTII